MLDLGLKRISRLVDAATLPWKAIHVGGTNGKGSVCASLNAMLTAANIRTSAFMSPHVLDRWDGISINGKTIQEDLFLDIENQVKSRNERLKLEATEFELLTTTAFEAFTREKAEVGIVEVGLGGRLDATNILQKPLATIITQISRDHHEILGDTVTEIATHKAGIMKPGVPCFADGSNLREVKEVLVNEAKKIEAGPLKFVASIGKGSYSIRQHLTQNMEAFQLGNLNLAYEACQLVLEEFSMSVYNPSQLLPFGVAATIPGRKQYIDVSRVTGTDMTILLDGSHNNAGAAGLNDHVKSRLRAKKPNRDGRITWILAFSESKEVDKILLHLLKRRDDVIAVEFGPVAGMPWVRPLPAGTITQKVDGLRKMRHVRAMKNIEEAFKVAAEIKGENDIVVAGSLYLVADVLRLLKEKGATRKELGFN